MLIVVSLIAMEIKKITAEQLKSRIGDSEDFLLVDVLPPEYYDEKHIAGAKNAPVYEVAFLQHMEKLTEDKNKSIVLYNESPDSLSAQDGAEKLLKAGYANVEIFPGGLSFWEEAGWEVEKGQEIEKISPKNGKHEIDVESSFVGWTGRNAKYAHRGKISLKSGQVLWEDGELVSGEFVLDMRTIKDEDLSDENLRKVLESHLKSSDFFDVEHFPEASFVFDDVKIIRDAPSGQSSCNILGTLIIKGIANKIEFPAMVVSMGDGSINGQAHFDFDRTLWNVRYGSEKFFEKLGMHLVNNIVSLEIFLVAKA